MSFQTGSIDKNGLARTEDGKLYVTSVGTASITGTQSTGLPVLLASSFVAVSGAADTNENTLATIAVPAGTFGSNGVIRLFMKLLTNNNANVKTWRVRFSGIGGTAIYTQAAANGTDGYITLYLAAKNSTSAQVSMATGIYAGIAGISTAEITTAVDSTAASTIVITATKATASDTMTLTGYVAEYIKASNA
jgi:hypothetical protein